jgi:hypothetical protein
MITFIGRGGLLRSSHLFGCKRSPSFQRFSTTNVFLSGSSLDTLELNGEDVRKDAKPSEVYQQRVRAGELTADPHQEKVVAQVNRSYNGYSKLLIGLFSLLSSLLTRCLII